MSTEGGRRRETHQDSGVYSGEISASSQGSTYGRSGGGSDGGGHSSTGHQTARGPPPDYSLGKPPSFNRPRQQEGPIRRSPSSRQVQEPPVSPGLPESPAPAAPPAVPQQTSGKRVVVQDRAYLYTEDYPFTYEQVDRQKENTLGQGIEDHDLEAQDDLPQMRDEEKSAKQLSLSSQSARMLEKLDKECAKKHLDAIGDSVVTHEELHSFLLMEGEHPVDELDLAGLENAPGVYNEVTQCCRLVVTSKNRLVFTQAKHSAEIGMPKIYGLMSCLPCFHEHWSRRKWTSYYAAINASEVLQVFVRQTLETNYETSKGTFNDILGACCCPMGGTMYSEKDITGMTQTLKDRDPHDCMSKFDHTRYMRHALIIRYFDCASNRILETVAFAHPNTPAANLFEMARSIQARITSKTAGLLKNKPTWLRPRAFESGSPPRPLYQRKSYRWILFILFAIALIFLAVSTRAALVMLFAVFLSLGGAIVGGKSQRKSNPSTADWVSQILGGMLPQATVVGTSGLSIFIYLIAAVNA